MKKVVGLEGFEPSASSTRTKRSTKLSYSPKLTHFKLLAALLLRAAEESLCISFYTLRSFSANMSKGKIDESEVFPGCRPKSLTAPRENKSNKRRALKERQISALQALPLF